jgi:hypothetical protein
MAPSQNPAAITVDEARSTRAPHIDAGAMLGNLTSRKRDAGLGRDVQDI